MSLIFWDTMLFVYLLEGDERYSPRVREVLQRSYERGDRLLTSHLALGEILAGTKGTGDTGATVHSTIEEMGFSFVPFDGLCVEAFSNLRRNVRLKAPDAIHIACAAAAKVDLFLTGDDQLLSRRLHVQGIQFIADFKWPLL